MEFRRVLFRSQVLPCAHHFVAGLAGVDQLDQVLDVAIEEVDADHAALAEAALIAEVEAVGGFRVEVGVADVVVVAVLPVEQGRDQFVDVSALAASGQRSSTERGVGKAGVSTCSSRWSVHPYNKQMSYIQHSRAQMRRG